MERRRFVLEGKEKLGSDLRPNDSAGWIDEDVKEEEKFWGESSPQRR